MIHVYDNGSNHWEVWSDTDYGIKDGLCIGIGTTRARALLDAKITLTNDTRRVVCLLKHPTPRIVKESKPKYNL